MNPQHLRKSMMRHLFFSIIISFIFHMAGPFSLTADAQWYPSFPPLRFPGLPIYSPVPQIPTYPLFTPFRNPLGLPSLSLNPRLPAATVQGALSPFLPNPIASIAGTTTIFVPTTITILDKVVIKPPNIEPIKLSSITVPLTVYIYPVGYVPPAPAPVTTVPATTITPTVIAPTASPLPASISGGLLFPFFMPFF
ncbi:MAG: hypothetical protein ACMUIA_00045 [bacterium]